MEKEMVVIKKNDGSTMEVELVTYLFSDDKTRSYVVYSKGEKSGPQEDEVIYISKIISNDGTLTIQEIVDDNEWSEVQMLLKKIANQS